MPGQLSSRGQIATQKLLRKDFELYFEAHRDLYHPKKNPKGAITLNIAENVLSWPRLKKKIKKISCNNDIPDWVAGYTSSLGHRSFRKVIASFFENHVTKVKIDHENLAISAGATATIEITSWMLGDHDDIAVFPAPCYPVYTMDIGNKAGVQRYDLITHGDVRELDHGPKLTIDHLDQALHEIQSQSRKMKMLVLTSPDNPTGIIYPLETLKEIAHWCIQNKVHMVVNEIYALSIISKKGKTKFRSFASIINQLNSDYLHMWYSFSKDLGISGFRIGVLYSQNKDLIKAIENYNAPHMVSNHTQWVVEQVLNDKEFIRSYIKQNQKNLLKSLKIVTKTLDQLSISYVKSYASLFVWLDLSKYLSEATDETEEHLWRDIFQKAKILLTPGEGFGHREKGLFRLVYSCVPRKHLKESMRRFHKYIESLSSEKREGT